ncbi:uncharacterized protein [Halyomorpha halys]|uniref:uncharacterized protein isoform X3 n=1 Tax=Halyomorpha halys TaxID=286706 RepID=UPI0034D3749C
MPWWGKKTCEKLRFQSAGNPEEPVVVLRLTHPVKLPTTRMAGRIVWAAYSLVICGYQLLYPAPVLLAAALPTGITADNETVYDYQGNADITSGGNISTIFIADNVTINDQLQDNTNFTSGGAIYTFFIANNETVNAQPQDNTNLTSGDISSSFIFPDSEILNDQPQENTNVSIGVTSTDISLNNETQNGTPQEYTNLTTEGTIANNETVYDFQQGNNNITSGDIWQITETAGNESSTDPPDFLLDRGGWTSKTQNSKLNLETEEGWLNSGIIANDAFIPYRGGSVSNRLGNSSEEWKKLLVKHNSYDRHQHGRVTKVQFNERRNIPFQFHWQSSPKRLFNSSKAS